MQLTLADLAGDRPPPASSAVARYAAARARAHAVLNLIYAAQETARECELDAYGAGLEAADLERLENRGQLP